MGLGKRALVGVGWTSVAAYTGALISFAGNVSLARLLGPADFGVYALATSMSTIVFLVSAFGSQEAIVQCREEGIQHLIPTALWMTIGLGITLASIGTLTGLYLRSTYGRSTGILVILLSWVNFSSMLNSACGAILQRALNYKPIAIIGTVATFISFSIAVLVAYCQGGVWSLLVREALQAVLMLLGLLVVTGYRLPFKFDRQAAGWIWNFGWKIMASGIGESLLTSLDKLAIGAFLGTITLGYYSIAYRLTVVGHQFSQGVVSSVSFSTFATLQNNLPRLCAVFERLYYWLFRLTLLLGLFVWFGGAALVVLVYGSQWQMAGNTFHQMSIVLVLLPLTGALKIFLIASGHINAAVKARVCQLALFTPAIFLATYYGQSLTVAVGVVSVSMIVSWMVMITYVARVIPVNWSYLMFRPLATGGIVVFFGEMINRVGRITSVLDASFIAGSFALILVFIERESLQAEWAVLRARLVSNEDRAVSDEQVVKG